MESPDSPSLAERLKAVRLQQGLSLSQLADRAGLGSLAAFRAETNEDAPLRDVLALFEAAGWTLVPVPRTVATTVTALVDQAPQPRLVLREPSGEAEAPRQAIDALERTS